MDLGAWLRELGLERYEQAFLANHIDAALLPDLTADDLIGLGVGPIGHRRKILAAISRLAAGEVAAQRTWPHDLQPSREEPASRVQAERRQVTVLFVDLVGFTPLSAALDAELVHGLLGHFFERLDGLVEGSVAPSTSTLATASWRCSVLRSPTATIPSGRPAPRLRSRRRCPG